MLSGHLGRDISVPLNAQILKEVKKNLLTIGHFINLKKQRALQKETLICSIDAFKDFC